MIWLGSRGDVGDIFLIIKNYIGGNEFQFFYVLNNSLCLHLFRETVCCLQTFQTTTNQSFLGL